MTVLVYAERTSEELDQFVQNDVEGLFDDDEKRDRLLIIKHQSPSVDAQLRMMMGGMMLGRPSFLYWLSEVPPKPPSKKSTDDDKIDYYRELAKEEINLRGWKRDDLKDMITTMLA
jgi:hypothetical protein